MFRNRHPNVNKGDKCNFVLEPKGKKMHRYLTIARWNHSGHFMNTKLQCRWLSLTFIPEFLPKKGNVDDKTTVKHSRSYSG